MESTILFRPVGQAELDLIKASDYRHFPPRLDFQPIFYPVLNEEYATKIARDWNTKDAASGHVGYVTKFAVNTLYLSRFDVQTAGSADMHLEYWIPSEQLDEFNENIVGKILVISEFKGKTP